MATKDTFQLMLTHMETSLLTVSGIDTVVYGRATEKITTDKHYVAYIRYLGDEVSEYSTENLGSSLGFQFQLEIGILIANTDEAGNDKSRWEAACDLTDWIETIRLTTNDNWGGHVQWWKIMRKPLTDQPKVILQIRI